MSIVEKLVGWFKRPQRTFGSLEVSNDYTKDISTMSAIIEITQLRRKELSSRAYDFIIENSPKDDLLDMVYFWSEYNSVQIMMNSTRLPREVFGNNKHRISFYWNYCNFYRLKNDNWLVHFDITPFVTKNIRQLLIGKLNNYVRTNHP